MFPGICRIWNVSKKQWDEFNLYIIPTSGDAWNEYHKTYPKSISLYYVGIDDYKGNRIFEGDIVQGYYENGEVRGIFPVKWNWEQAKFNISIDLVQSRKLVVIGNIVEHLHLLPGKYQESVKKSFVDDKGEAAIK